MGRWLKAENLRRALDHQPAIEVVETFNATSNAHMMAVNDAMGFRRHRAFSTYQGPLDRVLGPSSLPAVTVGPALHTVGGAAPSRR